MNRETRSASDIERSAETLLADLKEVVRDGQELLRTGANELGDPGAVTGEKLVELLEAAEEMGRKLQLHLDARATETGQLIRQNPYQSIGIAAGVGFLVGLLVMRR